MIQPKLIYGTAWKKEQTMELVLLAWRTGFRAFDTACQPKHYREELLGKAFAELRAAGVAREEFYVQTKFTPISGQDAHSIPYNPAQSIALQVVESFKISQKNLQTDYVDGLILHSPLSSFTETMDAWSAMRKIYQNGLVKYLGISNCYDFDFFKQLYEAAEIKPMILQNRFYQQSGYDRQLRIFCLERDIVYQSFWTLTANPHILEQASIIWLCRRFRKTPAQIFFRYLTQRGITPLTGTCDPIHMSQDLSIYDFSLTDEDLLSIDVLLK